MATVTLLGSSFTTTAGNKTVTATPQVGDLIVVICANTGRTTAQLPTLNDNGPAPGYSTIASSTFTKATSVDSGCAFVRNNLIQSATSHTWTMTQATDTGGGLAVYAIRGCARTGTNAIKQAQVQNNGAAAGTPTVALGAAMLTGNVGIGAVFNATSPATMTPRAAWTENVDVGYATPTAGLETMSIASGETASSIAWGGTSASAFAAVVIEINCAAEASLPNIIMPTMRAEGRAG